jgi:hypothetical protein
MGWKGGGGGVSCDDVVSFSGGRWCCVLVWNGGGPVCGKIDCGGEGEGTEVELGVIFVVEEEGGEEVGEEVGEEAEEGGGGGGGEEGGDDSFFSPRVRMKRVIT